MDTTSGTGTIDTTTATQAAEELKTSLATADAGVTQSIQTLGLVHQARLSRATRTVAALTVKYGASDSRVIAAQASVSSLKTTIAGITAAGARLAVPVLKVAAKGWALQGHVYDSNKTALARYTVYLADSGGIFEKQYGFVYTDDTGYFLINYSGDGDRAAGKAIFVAVLDTKANPVYVGPSAFQPVTGAATFQDIYVPAGGQTLGDPNVAIRDVAFPGKDAGTQVKS